MARPRIAVSRYKHRKNKGLFQVREAVLHARASPPDQQREGYSIPSQVKLLEEYAALNGIVIASSHVDVETARKSGRTAFGNMLRYLKRYPEVRIILVEKTDRLYRNLKDWAVIDDLGVEVHFVKENVVMSEGCRSSEKFVHGIKVLMAKAYVDNLSEETRKGMLEKAQQGLWPSVAPTGYINIVDPHGRKMIAPDPVLGPMVSRLFDWFSTGSYSLKAVTIKARADGLIYRRSGKPIGVSTVHHILRNRLYSGAFDWVHETYEGVHEPLTSPELWQEVQTILDGRSHTNVRSAIPEFLFRGLIKCGHCGCAVVAQEKKARYIYYRCSGYKGKCPERFVRQEVLEDHFLDIFRQLACTKDQFASIRGAIQAKGVEQGPAGSSVISLAGARSSPHMASALANDGIALLDLGRTASLRFRGLPAAMKRELLHLLLARCGWANGKLTAIFLAPFDILADYAAAVRGEGIGKLGTVDHPMLHLLAHSLQHPTDEVRRVIARYNAMVRVQNLESDGRRVGEGRPEHYADWMIEAEAA